MLHCLESCLKKIPVIGLSKIFKTIVASFCNDTPCLPLYNFFRTFLIIFNYLTEVWEPSAWIISRNSNERAFDNSRDGFRDFAEHFEVAFKQKSGGGRKFVGRLWWAEREVREPRGVPSVSIKQRLALCTATVNILGRVGGSQVWWLEGGFRGIVEIN